MNRSGCPAVVAIATLRSLLTYCDRDQDIFKADNKNNNTFHNYEFALESSLFGNVSAVIFWLIVIFTCFQQMYLFDIYLYEIVYNDN